jgi:hypothetical protein
MLFPPPPFPFSLVPLEGVEVDDEQAEKIFTPNDAVELLKTKMDVH